jgi:hypothetical protein
VIGALAASLVQMAPIFSWRARCNGSLSVRASSGALRERTGPEGIIPSGLLLKIARTLGVGTSLVQSRYHRAIG